MGELPQELSSLAEVAIDLGGLLSQTVAHMATTGIRSGGEPPSQDSIRAVLRGLFDDVLAPLERELPAAAVSTAADVLRRVVERYEEEVLLVALD